MYSREPFYVDVQKQDDQLEITYSSSVPIRNVALRTCRKQWTIGSWVLIRQHDDDDNDDGNIYKCSIADFM